jgi:Domain of unknown function (DUF4159)/Aerotolerance regulator N-terminal
MLGLGALSFAMPWALAALAALPALWWLLRVSPPSPVRIVFPPLRILASLSSREESAIRTPWWLLLLRLTLAVCVILGVAHPVLIATDGLIGSGPVYLLIDDGWASANAWEERRAALAQFVDRAEREGRGIVIVTTAPGSESGAASLTQMSAAKARENIQGLRPKPWATDRATALAALLRSANENQWSPGSVAWITDGLEQPAGAETIANLVDRVATLGKVTMVMPAGTDLALLLKHAEPTPRGLELRLVRSAGMGEMRPALRLLGDDEAPLARQTAHFTAGERRTNVVVDIPAELSSRLARIHIEGVETAGAVLLVDERWQRRAVGLLGQQATGEQPLLGPAYYLERALQPFAEVRQGDAAALLARPLAVLVLADVGTLDPATGESVRRWVEEGGVLLRFAGPRLARESSVDDPLLPVALRAGDRMIGGALSWTGAGRVAPFEPSSPFQGLEVPDDLRVHRQVIAEPSIDIADRTWARLDDGTPLVTGARRGRGWVVLVHTSASPDWSNLPLSGLFVEILKRIIDLARGGHAGSHAPTLPPLEALDAFGHLGAPPLEARAIGGSNLAETSVGPRHPPGFYGAPEAKRALNLGPSVAEPVAVGSLPASVRAITLGESNELDLRPWLLGAALILALLDFATSLTIRRLVRLPSLPLGRKLGALALALTLAVGMGIPSTGSAQSEVVDGTAVPATLKTRLAYVRVGDGRLDEVSKAGLAGLTAVVNQRTAAELSDPVGIDPETDELAFYPLLYWPLSDISESLSPDAIRKLSAYMRTGGTIVFDAGGRTDRGDRSTPRELARALDLPPLVPLAEDHVLHRSYYLLSELPGRRSGSPVWVEPAGEHVNDGVSSVVAGSSDWAGAWAVDQAKRPLFPVVPGGERQREYAYRFGVNLVMYVLTGNYKADQVHLPTILERLAP